MLDLKKATRLSGWITERDACETWLKSTHDSIAYSLLVDPDRGMYVKCRDLPQPGTYISQSGEFGDDERFSFLVESVELDDEMIVAVSEDEKGRIEIPFDELYCYDNAPDWLTLWAIDGIPSYGEIDLYNDCGISVYETESGLFYIGINGCGYDFYDAHWLPLYRKKGICWHSTESSWVAEVKARLSSYVEASIGLPSEMSWSERNDLLSAFLVICSTRSGFHGKLDWFSFATS